ncbi:uncharacterized protein LOC126879643 [Diabrotica virgifera virgifera]|uniref:Uncharacterized protein LOC114345115 n=1 Tax=Diabrotica virgifera virgifera TaxID=50390 RepID=A0A6P7GQ66_DIAVI|nr:uncharacterized protein LOC126879643 [Diabrotica virgifera virgifera]
MPNNLQLLINDLLNTLCLYYYKCNLVVKYLPLNLNTLINNTLCFSEGRDTTLCVPNDKSIRVRRPFYWPYNRKRISNRSVPLVATNQNQQTSQQRRRRVKFQEEKDTNNQTNEGTENAENIAQKKHKKKKRKQIDYSLRVSNINKSLRPKEFKELLKERGIKPTNITWRGYRGICFLHYAKKNYKKENDDSDAINSVIEIIQELKLNPTKPEENLNVEVMEPITRIETVDVTAV